VEATNTSRRKRSPRDDRTGIHKELVFNSRFDGSHGFRPSFKRGIRTTAIAEDVALEALLFQIDITPLQGGGVAILIFPGGSS
jgi:hypothetical protein